MNTTSFPYERVLQTFSALLVELRALQALVQSATVDEQRSVDYLDSSAHATGFDISALLAGLQNMQELISETLAIITTSDGETEGVSESAAFPLPSFGMLSSSASSLVARGADDIVRSLLDALRVRLEQLGDSFDVLTAERGTRIQVTDVEQITILLVDSWAVSRAGLHRLLESYPGLHVIGEAVDGLQAVSETLELGPQVVVLDAQLPDGQSLEALRQIKQLNLNTHVLVLATQDREAYLYETLRAGADGYVLKDIAPDELAAVVRSVARGDVLIQPQIASRLLSRYGRQERSTALYNTLTTRELEVLRLLARGLRNKEIAARLFVSERTVNFHLANIYQKLQVSGRTEALSKALEQGLITTS